MVDVFRCARYNRFPRNLIPGFKVDYTANQRHSQRVAFTAVAVWVCRNFEYFDLSVDVFDQDAFAGNAPVLGLFFGSKLASFWLFLRCFAVFVQFQDTLITAVALDLYLI